MKKWTIATVCLVLACLMALPAMAEGTTQFTVTADKTEVTAGDVVTFTVSASGSNACTSYMLDLKYDTAKFELVGGSVLATGTTMADFDNVSFVIGYGSATVPTGTVAQFQLKVKTGAATGGTSVTVDPAVKNESAAVTSSATGANVTIGCNHVYDDNCDKTCNSCNAERVAPHTPDAGVITDEPDCATGKAGTKTYTCTACQQVVKTESVAAQHDFDENWISDGAKHWHKCKTCGAKGAEAAHTAGEWFSDGTNHWHVCTACQAVMDKGAHTPGAAATEYAGQKCTTCQKELKPALGHTCTFSNKWTTDGTGHWHECTGCEDISEYGTHVFDNACDTDCNTCGYTRNPEHIYAERWSQNAEGHWHECELCGEGLEIEAHQKGPEATLGSPQICVVCGYEIAPSLGHTHKYEGQWQKDAEGHWKTCSCGMDSEKAAHNWDKGVVTREPTNSVVGRRTYTCLDCGEQKSESIDTVPGTNLLDNTTDKPGFPWWLIIVLVAIPVVAVCVYIVLGVAKSKKQTGKYSQQTTEEPDEASDTE